MTSIFFKKNLYAKATNKLHSLCEKSKTTGIICIDRKRSLKGGE